MSNCEKHKKEVAGISDMKELAVMIGDLHYETLSFFLMELGDKLYEDGKKDWYTGRYNLSSNLFEASGKIRLAFVYIKKAWQISKPFMETQHPLNK